MTARARTAAAILVLSLAVPCAGSAQERPALVSADSLRLEWTVESAPPGRRVAGYLYNDNIVNGAHMWLRVDELGSDGQVSAFQRRRLFGEVPARGRMAFDVSVSAAASYRVIVESVEWVMECR